jgi:hypothetical protein
MGQLFSEDVREAVRSALERVVAEFIAENGRGCWSKAGKKR